MTFFSFSLQWLWTALTVAAVIYLPGRLLLRQLKLNENLNPLERLAGALVSGCGLLVLFYWLLSYLQVQFLLWFYLAAAGWELWETFRDDRRRRFLPSDPDKPLPAPLSSYWPLGLVMLAGMLLQTRFTAWTAWQTDLGMNLLAWHAHDAPWHVFNIYQMSRHFPAAMPGFSGDVLRNYHMFSDLMWGAVLRLAPGVNPWHIYFRVAPFLYSGLLTLTTFLAARAWSGRLRTAYLAVVLTVFCSNFTWLLPLLFDAKKYFFWDSIFWNQSPFGMIFNPGVSSSFAFVMFGLWALVRWLRERKWPFLILAVVAWSVLPGFKVYPGLLVLSALFLVGLAMIIYQKDHGMMIAFACVLPFFLMVFLPPNLHAPSLVRFLPGFNLGSMLVAPDRMALMSSTSLKILFAQKPWLVALLMAGLLLVYLVGNLGSRSLGLVSMVRNGLNLRTADPILLFIGLVVAEALAASTLFVQTGTQWNTIQFFYYAVLLSSLPAAEQFWAWAGHWPRPRLWLMAGLLVALGLPSTIQAVIVVNFNYSLNRPACEALDWLRRHSQDGQVILRPLPDALMTPEGWQQFERNQERGRMTSMSAWKKEAQAYEAQAAGNTAAARALAPALDNLPAARVNLRAPSDIERDDTAIVAGLTGRDTFLEDTVSVQILGYPVEERAREILHFYRDADAVEAREFLEKHNISYVILFPGMRLPFDPAGLPLKKEFENEAMTIYKHILLGGW